MDSRPSGLKEEDMIARVAKAITEVLRRPHGQSIGIARAAIEAVADHLDRMETGSDEDMMAVEWITGLLRDAALKSPSGV